MKSEEKVGQHDEIMNQKISTVQSYNISIGNHTHSSPIWEIIVLAILKIVRGEAEYNF